MKHSKRYCSLLSSIGDSPRSFSDAIESLRQLPTKFDQSVEIHVRLGIDPSKSDQAVRTSATLPHGTGKKIRIAAFVTPLLETACREAGADIVGGEDLIQEIAKTGATPFDVAIAIPEFMKMLGPIAKTLGQKGLMPNPKTGTVTPDPVKAITELKKGKVNFKNDDGGNVHQSIGKISFSVAQLEENFNAFLEALRKAKPESTKKTFIQAVYVTTTMGPSIQIQL